MSETVTPLDKPLRLTVGNLKGGVGRSTTSVSLALALARRTGQRVMLVDADGSNGTSYEWSELAGEDWPTSIVVNYWPSLNLAKRIQDAGHDGHVVIDTGPHDAAILRQALMVSDHLVMPIAASPSEVARVQPTLSAAAEVGMNHPLTLSILFTRTKPGTVSLRDARAAMTAAGDDVGFTVHTDDVPFLLLHSQAYGQVPEDLGNYPAVLEEIITLTGGAK
jgi:chromosome partitioning protein